MAAHVINEARRCLQCKKPLCRIKGCPIQTDIPEMIRLFLAGQTVEAGRMLFENNPLSVVCSLVCDHENQSFKASARTPPPFKSPASRITFPIFISTR